VDVRPQPMAKPPCLETKLDLDSYIEVPSDTYKIKKLIVGREKIQTFCTRYLELHIALVFTDRSEYC